MTSNLARMVVASTTTSGLFSKIKYNNHYTIKIAVSKEQKNNSLRMNSVNEGLTLLVTVLANLTMFVVPFSLQTMLVYAFKTSIPT